MSKIMHKEIQTIDNGTILEHYFAFPNKDTKHLPTILLFHAWSGRDHLICEKANELASLGYLAVAVDLYGKNIIGNSTVENQKLMQPFINDRNFLRNRLKLVFKEIIEVQPVQPNNMIGIGYCFGGLCVLDAVRNDFGLKAAISVHGKYDRPKYKSKEKYPAKTLILHGIKDTIAPFQKLLYLKNEFSKDASI